MKINQESIREKIFFSKLFFPKFQMSNLKKNLEIDEFFSNIWKKLGRFVKN